MNEWEFTADAVSWINEILAKDPGFPFTRAKCEQRGKDSRKRRDLRRYLQSYLGTEGVARRMVENSLLREFSEEADQEVISRLVAAFDAAIREETVNCNEAVLQEAVNILRERINEVG